jgi:hypothetical protein
MQEVAAARTICERGVLLIGTAHGSSLSSLLRNPELRPLVGGVEAVTLGDAEAKATNNGQKVRWLQCVSLRYIAIQVLKSENDTVASRCMLCRAWHQRRTRSRHHALCCSADSSPVVTLLLLLLLLPADAL